MLGNRFDRVGRIVSAPDLPPAFHQLWIGKTASGSGDFLVSAGVPILAAVTTESANLVAAVTTALAIPWLLFGLGAGAIVDRVDRRAALIGMGIVRTVVFSAAALLTAAGILPALTLVVVAVMTGVAKVMNETAVTSLTPHLVEKTALDRANSRLLTAELVTETLSVLVAGALAGIGGVAVFATGALCALAGLFALLRLRRYPLAAPSLPRTTDEHGGLLEGFRVLWSIPALRLIALIGAVINTAWDAFLTVFILYAIAPGPIGLSPFGYGLLMTVSIAGGIAGSTLAPRLLARWGHRSGVGLNIFANGVTFAAPVLFVSPWMIGLVFLVSDAATPLWRVATVSLQQRAVPEAVRGRAFAAYRIISLGAATTGPAIGVAIASQTGSRGLFAILSIACFALLIPFFLRISERSMNP